ncbi:short-chain dehydrogenase [Dyadobacter beijingensis]|uniref:Short-chain dehydrogenase n=1 Tax=Dyadobacter beijingensis TaxID=365489 RepID=A0ABQ2IBY1_9BACT|nr:SDR family oxidoreductase [Dyadobacter beijingensis]GGN05810.1 short-chain dehydrogenase [Dyadobacter beijingensis]
MKLSEQFKLNGKTALVTGASQGIGKAIALALAEYGAKIILHYRKDRSEAEAVADEIRRAGGEANLVHADLSRSGSAAFIAEQVGQLGKTPDILVINASVQIPAEWEQVTTEDFDKQVNANFRSTLQLMQAFAPAMVSKGWGRILTIGSVQQTKPHPAMIVYAATKSAVLNMVQNVAMQLADKHVTVNNLAPGVIGTPRLEQDVPPVPERIDKRLETPSGALGEPQDCAAMAVLLCSEAGRFITGQNIFIDGGMSL